MSPREIEALAVLQTSPMTTYELAYRTKRERAHVCRTLQALKTEGRVTVVRELRQTRGRRQNVWGVAQ